MTGWAGSNRRSRLPGNWKTLRRDALRRDHGRCVAAKADGTRCPAFATDVDHLVAGDDHSLSNLQSLCAYHHKRKTIGERPRRPKQKRPEEKHPGLISP